MTRPFRRIVACLDVAHGRLVKGKAFRDLVDRGEPAALARRYEAEGADEIVFLDIAATPEARRTMLDAVVATANSLFIPLTVGGGVRTLADASELLRAGADKVAVNTAAVLRPQLLGEIAQRFGAQSVVLAIDAREDPSLLSGRRVVIRGGTEDSAWDAIEFAARARDFGAGELLVTSIARDGSRAGYDLELLRRLRSVTSLPIVASGGAGTAQHLVAALSAGADAALVAGILHDGSTTLSALKRELLLAGIETRPVLESLPGGRK